MSTTVWLEIGFVGLHQKRPSDYNLGGENPKLSFGGVVTSVSKYSLEAGFGDPGEDPWLDGYDYAEFQIVGASFDPPPALTNLTYQTEGGTATFSRYRPVTVPDDFSMPYPNYPDIASEVMQAIADKAVVAIQSKCLAETGVDIANHIEIVSFGQAYYQYLSKQVDLMGEMITGDISPGDADRQNNLNTWEFLSEITDPLVGEMVRSAISNSALIFDPLYANMVIVGTEWKQTGLVSLLPNLDGIIKFNAGSRGSVFFGSEGTDNFYGGLNDDVALGGDGVDILTGDAGEDVLLGGGGTDNLNGGDGSDRLDGGIGQDIVAGGAGDDFITSGALDQLADGGDLLVGGDGDDIYKVYTREDVILEYVGGGNRDQIYCFTSYTLTESMDIEFLVAGEGSGFYFGLTGNSMRQVIVGNSNDNVLHTGGGAADSMIGYAGNDTYRVFNRGDTIEENATGGTADRVISAVDYALAAGVYVEIMQTNGSTATSPIDLTGNTLRQEITGNYGANVLRDGGGASDVLRGLNGNDTYQIYSSGTAILENATASAGTGDRVMAGVDYALGSGVGIEIMTTNGSTGTSGIDLTGNEVVQTIIGNAGSNILDGKGGNDTLTGLGGKDFFVFSLALGATNVDKITDFNVADDTIRLENTIFTALTTTGALSASLFKDTFVSARDADDLILYNSNTGSLFYDADGIGGAVAVKFASLVAGLALTPADFLVI